MDSNSELHKLRMDTRHFCKDHGLTTRFGFLKLAIVIDYWPVLHYRLLKYIRGSRNPLKMLLKISLLVVKPFVDGLSGCKISVESEIDAGLLLHHSTGIIIGSGVTIGKNCILFSGACVVFKANNSSGKSPRIGNNVKLMVGSKVIGAVTIGDNSFVGANAVVLTDVPANSIAVGVPAIVKLRNDIS